MLEEADHNRTDRNATSLECERLSLPDFVGEHYLAVLDRLHRELRPKSYFEIGSEHGKSLALAQCASLAVDPKFQFDSNPTSNKPLCALYQMPSDDFFAAVDPTVVLGSRIDFAFLDGMHLCEFLLRDFLNTERFCSPNSVIALHDCLPLDFVMAERQYSGDRETDLHRKYWWTGDVWRFALLLKRRRPDLRIAALDAPPTGLLLVTNLDPTSTQLRDRYESLVEEMDALSLRDLTLAGLHAELKVEPTSTLMNFAQIAAGQTGTIVPGSTRASGHANELSSNTIASATFQSRHVHKTTNFTDEQHIASHQVDQESFENSKEIRIDRLPLQTRSYLVMVRAGSQPRSTFFAVPLSRDRTFDVALNYYAPPHPDDLGFSEADVVFAGGLSKFHGAKLFLASTGYLERYKGVLFLDDDLDLLFELDEFFEFCETSGLHLAQASLWNAADSFCNWQITRNHPGLVMRTTNFVEVMGPFFAREFLKEMLHSFDLSLSCWGLDIYWGHHLGDKYKAAIIDQFQMKHTKPIDTASGPWYAYLRNIGIDGYKEMRELFDRIGRDRYDIHPNQIIYREEHLWRPT